MRVAIVFIGWFALWISVGAIAGGLSSYLYGRARWCSWRGRDRRFLLGDVWGTLRGYNVLRM
jgi:hypothetical protein